MIVSRSLLFFECVLNHLGWESAVIRGHLFIVILLDVSYLNKKQE